MAGINHLDRIQRLPTRLVSGIRHLPYEEGLQRLGLHSTFKIFTGLLGVDFNLFFSLPLVAALEGIPTSYSKVRATAGGEGQLFRWGF